MKNTVCMRGGARPRFTLAVFALCAASASAGVKYWSNPAFKAYDADSYVQDGLVLNYDGIRNAGLDQEHSYDTTTWVNLGSEGAKYNLTQSVKTSGVWGDDGFNFQGKTTYASTTAFTIGTQYTTQALLDANTADQGSKSDAIGYVFFPVTPTGQTDWWKVYSIGVRGSKNSAPNVVRLNIQAYFTSATDISGTSFGYTTAIIDETKSWFFSGTAKSGVKNLSSGKTLVSITPSVWGIGGNPTASGTGYSQCLFGTIKSYRHYNRALEEGELVWNRAVDQTRYFGAAPLTAIPVTNAVVTSTFPAVSGDQPGGAYAVDADGYTFTAPASKTVNGRSYTCTGYTLEEWDATIGDWGSPVSHPGELSCAATGTSRIRITWQWTAGDGIVTYDVCDYVQDGLVLNYDGIRNVGADFAHSDATETWVNLANPGTHDLAVYRKTAGAALTWAKDGYKFGNGIVFRELASGLVIPGKSTTQTLIDARNIDHSAFAYVWFPQQVGSDNTYWSTWSGSVRKNGDKKFYYNTHSYTTGRPGLKVDYDTIGYTYITALANETYASCFTGVEEPPASEESTGTTSADYRRYAAQSGKTIPDRTLGNWSLGGGPAGGDPLTGKIKNFRLYNRVLTTEELRQNRMVDDARYFNAPPVTNVVIATGRLGFLGDQPLGNYQISGTYTFSAPTETQVDDRGFEYTLDGYTLETWDDAIQGWGAPVAQTGSSYTWTDGVSPAKVRVTWQWKATKALLSVATYDVQDYVADGLVLNYDGIRNVGAGEEHDDEAVDWVNLAPGGKFNATRVDYSKTTGGPGSWASDGFVFDDQTSFFPREAFPMSTRVTEQVVLNANAADQTSSDGIGYVFFPVESPANTAWQRGGSISVRYDKGNDSVFLEYCAHYYGYADDSSTHWANWLRPQVHQNEDGFDCCATAVLDGNAAMFFPGTRKPTSGSRYSGYVAVSNAQHTRPIVPFVADTFRIGGTGSQYFTGTLKSFRYYDRVLTEAELVRNRQVDSARYFGKLAFTNVVVTANGFDADPAPGAYAVEGSWTFSVAKGESEDAPTAVRLRTIDRATGEVIATRFLDAKTWTYDADAENGALVEIDWRAAKPFVIVLR